MIVVLLIESEVVNMDELMTIDELAEKLKLSKRSIRRLMTVDLPHKKIGGSVRFEADKIKEWIDKK